MSPATFLRARGWERSPARYLKNRFGNLLKLHIVGSMKSAFELAMSRLEKESPTQKLTDDQKSKLAEVDAEITAKIAEQKALP